MFLGSQFSWIAIAIHASLDYIPVLDLCYAIFTFDMIGCAFSRLLLNPLNSY